MTLAVFHDFPGLENGFSKFHDFPWLSRRSGHPGVPYTQYIRRSDDKQTETYPCRGLTAFSWRLIELLSVALLLLKLEMRRRLLIICWWWSSSCSSPGPRFTGLQMSHNLHRSCIPLHNLCTFYPWCATQCRNMLVPDMANTGITGHCN